MARIEPIPPQRMTAEQRRLHEMIAARRTGGKVSGPFAVLLHAPEIGKPVAALIDQLLSDSRVPHKLKEIAILAIARKYTAQYEWFVHERRARRFGVDDAVIEAIRHRRHPDFGDPIEELVYDMTNEIVDARRLGDDHYARAVAALGEAAVVELVVLIGFYISVAVLLVSYQVEVPDSGAVPLSEAESGPAPSPDKEAGSRITTSEPDDRLPPVRRIVTGHDPNGRAVVTMDGPAPNRQVRPHGTVSTLIWGSDETPAEIGSAEDFGARDNVIQPPSMGSWLRVVDFPPGTPGRMHRIDSLDYVVCMAGAIDMELDDGATVHMEAGDVMIQQGTNHSWINRGNETCRIAFALLDAKRKG